MQHRAASACCLVVLLVVSPVATAVPAAASATTQPSAVSTETANATTQADSEFDGTAFLAVDEASDGDLVAGGVEVAPNASSRPALANTTATLARVGENGTEWSTSVGNGNTTAVRDVLAADDGIYFLLVESRGGARGPGSSRSADVRLGKASSGGEVRWQESLNGTLGFTAGTGGSLVDTDDGVALARQVPGSGVRLTEYDGRTVAWERTYDVEARVGSVRATDDGFLLAGSVGFDEPWVLRTAESGQPVFNETYPGIESAGVLGAVPTDDGGALVAGRHRPGFDAGSGALTARLDGDGQVRWTRVHGTGSDVQLTRVFGTERGLLLAGQSIAGPGETGSVRLLGVGADGAELAGGTVEDVPRVTAMTRSDDSLRVAGLEGAGLSEGDLNAVFRTIQVPSTEAPGDASLAADTALASNETHYRGQDIRVRDAGLADTYTLVRLPGEFGEFEPQEVRQVTLGDDGTAVFESATLPEGKYVLRMPYDRPVAVEDGRVQGPADRSEAAFRVEEQRLFRVETNRTLVDVAAGERRLSLTLDSDRQSYEVHVRADRFRGGAAGATDLREAFGQVDGFEGIDTVDGQPAARIAVGDRGDEGSLGLTADVADLRPGLYDVVVSGADTRDGGAVADGRFVVGTPEEHPVGLELGAQSLTVGAGEEVRTNVTLTGLTGGAGALALSANRTGDPDVRLRLDADVNASRVSAGGGVSPRESTTELMAFDADTPTGSVEVARLEVRGESLGREPLTNGTNTATLRVDWVVDEDGVPYTAPEPVTVAYEVTGAGNATGAGDSPGDGGAGGGRSPVSGGASGSAGGGSA